MRTILRAIGGVQATEYRDNLKRNVKRGARGTTEQGYWSTRAPFGYRRKVVYPPGRDRVLENGVRKAVDEKIILVTHAAEARMVASMFRRYATGTESINSLVEWALTKLPGRRWTRAAVRYMLTNPAYLGDVVFGRMPADHVERAETRVRPESEWYGRERAHEPVIDRPTFARVQALLGEHRQMTRGVRSDWILSGIVRCRCGASMASSGGGHAGKNPRTYRCVTKGMHASARCPYPGAILKPWLEEAMLATLASVIESPKGRARTAQLLDGIIEAVSAAPALGVAAIAREQRSLEEKRDRLLAAVEDGTVTSIEAQPRLAALRGHLREVTVRRDALERPAAIRDTLIAEREAILAQAADFATTARTLSGPALREFIRPWVRHAVFDTDTRVLRVEVRHLPAVLPGLTTMGDLANMEPRSTCPSRWGTSPPPASSTPSR
jgi:hypothetical protein